MTIPLWQESLNTDGQQFHQYQQNEQSPLTLTHLTQKQGRHITLEIRIIAMDRHTDAAGLNRLIGCYKYTTEYNHTSHLYEYTTYNVKDITMSVKK